MADSFRRAGFRERFAGALDAAADLEAMHVTLFNNIVDNKTVEHIWLFETVESWNAEMKSSTGRWVSGDDFFDRIPELERLETLVRDGNHVLLFGQRRMGKTSIARELGRRLELQGWASLFTDVEGATCPEDVIADIAAAAHSISSISSRIANVMGRFFVENVEEISVSDFRFKFRAGINGNWQRHGTSLIEQFAEHQQPVLLVIDELPIFLIRLLREKEGDRQVEEFLSWLRGVFQVSTANPRCLSYPAVSVSPHLCKGSVYPTGSTISALFA